MPAVWGMAMATFIVGAVWTIIFGLTLAPHDALEDTSRLFGADWLEIQPARGVVEQTFVKITVRGEQRWLELFFAWILSVALTWLFFEPLALIAVSALRACFHFFATPL